MEVTVFCEVNREQARKRFTKESESQPFLLTVSSSFTCFVLHNKKNQISFMNQEVLCHNPSCEAMSQRGDASISDSSLIRFYQPNTGQNSPHSLNLLSSLISAASHMELTCRLLFVRNVSWLGVASAKPAFHFRIYCIMMEEPWSSVSMPSQL